MWVIVVSVERPERTDRSIWGPFKRLETAMAYAVWADAASQAVDAQVRELYNHRTDSMADYINDRMPVVVLTREVIPNP